MNLIKNSSSSLLCARHSGENKDKEHTHTHMAGTYSSAKTICVMSERAEEEKQQLRKTTQRSKRNFNVCGVMEQNSWLWLQAAGKDIFLASKHKALAWHYKLRPAIFKHTFSGYFHAVQNYLWC